MTELRRPPVSRCFTSSFTADLDNLRNAVNGTLAYYDNSFGLMDESTRFELKVVLNELLVNAIKHGGKAGSPCRIKTVAGLVAEDCALLFIEDDGAGYDATNLEEYPGDAYQESRIGEIAETGRGIHIVKRLCDMFVVNESGNKVVITKRLRKSDRNI